MKKKIQQLLLAVAALFTVCSPLSADSRKICLDEGWRFHYGEATAQAVDFDDSQWRQLDLPHDWSVETEAAETAGGEHIGPFSTTVKGVGNAECARTLGGEAWYRRSFTLTSEDADKQLSLYFEGVYNHAEVWLNGRKIYFNHYGYAPFRFDITPFVNAPGQENVLAVHVLNKGVNTRWYAGSGIYRHVWLLRTPKVYADQWDTFVRLKEEVGGFPTLAHLEAETKVFNASTEKVTARVEICLLNAAGKEVAQAQQQVAISAYGAKAVRMDFTVANPNLWSPEHPHRYKAVVKTVDVNAGNVDEFPVNFGIRSISFSADKGFLLNDSSVLLQGGCIHHGLGLLGAAAYNRAIDRKLQLLKDQGFNAVRCSHNIPDEHFLDACDSIGLLCIEEAFDQWLVAKNTDDYHLYFEEFSDRDVQSMVRRDRNHPSVIMWSIGNEIPGRIETEGLKAAERLRQTVRQFDTTRPVTAAVCGWNSPSRKWEDEDNLAFRSLDVGGYNYLYDKYERDHSTHPDRVMVGLESYPKRAAENWNLVEKHPYVIGDFVWTAMDYLGESGIGSASIRNKGKQSFTQPWPWFNGWCGDIDLIGTKKPQSYYRDVVWRRRAITMGVEDYIPDGYYQSISAWGWQVEHQDWTDSVAGRVHRVNVYSRSPRVKLYLNDQLIGEKATSSTFWAGFDVPFKSGTLKAVTAEGEAFELTTPGVPQAIRLVTDRTTINANGTDLSYVTIELVDSKGQVVPDSQRKLSLSVTGQGVLLAAGNAAPNDMESFRSATPRFYRGRALAILKSTRNAGKITLKVKCKGLSTQTVVVNTQ